MIMKYLLLAAIVAAVWYGFKAISRRNMAKTAEDQRNGVRQAQFSRRHPDERCGDKQKQKELDEDCGFHAFSQV